MKRTPLAIPILVAGLAACADQPTTTAAPPPQASSNVAVAFELREGLVLAVDDARSRVIPTLGNAGAVNGVDQTFAVLREAVRTNDTAAVRDAIAGAAGTLNALERSAPSTNPVEVAALRLVLLNADVLYPAQ